MGSQVTIRIDDMSWSYSGQGEIWCPVLGRVVYNLSTWCNFFHSSRYGVMCGDETQDVGSYIQKWHVRTLLIHECGWMMLWLLGAFWRDHHTSQTWYRCSSSSWVSTSDVLLFPLSLQRHWLCILLGGGVVRLWMWSNVNQSSCEIGQWNMMWLILTSPPHIIHSSIWFNNQGDITTLFRYFQRNDKAASLEILPCEFPSL